MIREPPFRRHFPPLLLDPHLTNQNLTTPQRKVLRPPKRRHIHPLLIIHSNSWSSQHSLFYGRPHFDVVRDLILGVNHRGYGGWFVTSRTSPSSPKLLTPIPAP